MIEVTLGIGAGLVLVGLLLLGAALWQAERPKERRLPGWWSLLPCAVGVIGAGTLMLLTGLDKPRLARP